MEASNAIRDASHITLPQTLKARVVTTAVGFRIGPLGVDYSSKRVELDPEAASGQGDSSSPGLAYEQAKSRSEAAAALTESQAAAAAHPDPLWRKGLTAYAKAQNALAASPPTLLAVA